MRGRARAAARTRARIIDAAHTLLDRPGDTGLTLQEVAAAAGVTRATIYKSLGSRRELLAAVFENQGRRIEYERVRAVGGLADPGEAVLETVRESCRAWSLTPEAIRKTLALSVVDAEVGDLVARYEGYRRAEMMAVARRAYEAGVLGDGVTLEHAGAVLGLVTSFAAFDVLRVDGVSVATEHLVRTARAALEIGFRKGS
ncbi:MAG: TetR/AcrR family transcriptional regulator [Longimicrobiales bacterium]